MAHEAATSVKRIDAINVMLDKLAVEDESLKYIAGVMRDTPGPVTIEHTFADGSALIGEKDRRGKVEWKTHTPLQWKDITAKRDEESQRAVLDAQPED